MSQSSCQPLCSLCAFWNSSIGKKIVVALTGAFLFMFLAGHLVGNMLIFQSSEAFNHYAHFLHTMLHGWGIWIFRALMCVSLFLHIIATIQLTRANRAARPSRYQADNTMVASKSSRAMIWTGLGILAFFIWHILHYTVRVQPELQALANANENWAMTVIGFQSIPMALFYVLGMALLCSHLSHGVASVFQTLGLRTKKTAKLITCFSKLYALVILLGFCSIPLAISLGGYGKKEASQTIKTLPATNSCSCHSSH